ncbi:MAG: hypothetical protein EBS84_12685 [Proteobacteria bacterium]|nr:hypothetical protein [Pseudomonadota bacterium]
MILHPQSRVRDRAGRLLLCQQKGHPALHGRVHAIRRSGWRRWWHGRGSRHRQRHQQPQRCGKSAVKLNAAWHGSRGATAACETWALRTIRSWLYLHLPFSFWQADAVKPRVPLALLLGLLACVGHTSEAHGQGALYSLIDLDALGAPSDKPAALNRAGIVAGTRSLSSPGLTPLSRAFVFTNSIFELGFTNVNASASDLNEHGDVVGWARLPQAGGLFAERAVLWQRGRQLDLGTLGGTNSRAFGINERVDITGAAQTKSGAFHAFLFRQAKMTDLGTLGGINSYGHAINSAFDIAGVSDTAQQVRHAFLYTGGKLRDLGTLGGILSQANALNEQADVVGFAQNPAGQSRAFLYTKGKMIDLGTLGGPGSFANAVNNRMHVVGAAQLATGENRAFLWRDGKMWDLNQSLPPDSGWFLLEATDINESGLILCVARTRHGQLRAVLLSPPGIARPGAR